MVALALLGSDETFDNEITLCGFTIFLGALLM